MTTPAENFLNLKQTQVQEVLHDSIAVPDELQANVLGAIVGFINGYLVWGTLWYFMHINNYPLNPYISQPPPGSPSAQAVNILPLYVLAGGPDGAGNLLSLAVILLFVFVLIVI
ncbi:MAG: hypothetical protein DWB42_12360 [Chloroflexi bacterium]|nr:hypothetical protein [Chloroflexota bacterium]